MFCEIAPFSLRIESISLTGSSELRHESLFNCRTLLFDEMSEMPLAVAAASSCTGEFVTVPPMLPFLVTGLLS